MSKTKAMAIGGPVAGRTFEIEYNYLRVSEYPEVRLFDNLDSSCPVNNIHNYRLERLIFGIKPYNFLVSETLTLEEAFDSILNHYADK